MASQSSKKKTQKPAVSNKMTMLLALIAATAGTLLYAGTISFGFTLDDASVIEQNRIVRQGLDGLGTIFSTSYRSGYWTMPGTLYRPLSLAMFAIEFSLAPDSAWLHHLINILLYGLTGGLIVVVLSRYLGSKMLWVAFATALLFMAHPIHTEVAANIKSRDEILALLFALLSLLWLHKYYDRGRFTTLILALTWYLLALFSKEGAITFLAVFPLFGLFFVKTDLPRLIKTSALFLIPAAIFMVARWQVLGTFGGIDVPISRLDNYLAHLDTMPRLASAVMISGLYLLKLVVPHPLYSDLGWPALPTVGWSHPAVLVTSFLLASLLVVAVKGIKKKNLLACAILFFFITFSIVSNWIILIGSSYGERFLYTPSLGFCLATAVALWQLSRTSKTNNKTLKTFLSTNNYASVALGVILLLYGAKTLHRQQAWKDSFTLYSVDAQKVPECTKLRYHYGLELNKTGERTRDQSERTRLLLAAEVELKAALAKAPLFGEALSQMGLVNYRLGKPDIALDYYEQALEHSTNKSLIYSNMGIIFFERGQTDKAIEVYQKAVELDPTFVDARRNLGASYAKTRRFEEAVEQFSEALRYAPNDATINYYLGLSWRDLGQPEKARPWFEKAKRLNPQLQIPEN